MATRESVDRVIDIINADENRKYVVVCLLYTSPSPRD